MDKREIFAKVDHTLLTQTASWEEIRQICEDAITYGTASVCIPPSYVKQAEEYLQGKVKVCTVIGFPNGYNTTAVKGLRPKMPLQMAHRKLIWSSIWDGLRTSVLI